MKISARNHIPGIIRHIQPGAVNAEVTLEIAPGVEVVSIVTQAAVANLGLVPGKKAYAVIKSSSVMIGVDD